QISGGRKLLTKNLATCSAESPKGAKKSRRPHPPAIDRPYLSSCGTRIIGQDSGQECYHAGLPTARKQNLRITNKRSGSANTLRLGSAVTRRNCVTEGIHGSAADRGTFRDVRGRSPTIRLTLASAGSSHHAYNYTYLSQITYNQPLEINSLVSENLQVLVFVSSSCLHILNIVWHHPCFLQETQRPFSLYTKSLLDELS